MFSISEKPRNTSVSDERKGWMMREKDGWYDRWDSCPCHKGAITKSSVLTTFIHSFFPLNVYCSCDIYIFVLVMFESDLVLDVSFALLLYPTKYNSESNSLCTLCGTEN